MTGEIRECDKIGITTFFWIFPIPLRLGVSLDRASRERIEHPEKPDPDDPPPLGELVKICEPFSWEDKMRGAREWLGLRCARGALDGSGVDRLMADLRSRADRAPGFCLFHILALELLCILRENGGKGALARSGFARLPVHFLAAAGTPAAVAKQYRRRLR